jgi:Na+(H+)/acetate symporter ActP
MAMGKFNITTTTQGRSIFSRPRGQRKQRQQLTIDKDIMVLANPEIANLPNWVIALVAARL